MRNRAVKVGDFVKQGDIIAQLGDAKVNGDYAPHLHFQIMKQGLIVFPIGVQHLIIIL